MLDSRITKKAPYGQHVTFYCVNHPDLRWMSKNIAPLGVRSIFFRGRDNGTEVYEYAPECKCPLSDLRLCENYKYMPDVEE